MQYLILLGLWVIGSLLGSALYYNVQDGEVFGATIARTTITNPWTFSATTTMNANLNITHTNSATSTLIAGCWQFYATSTATPLRYLASTTPGIMYSSYGSCPRI
jgi:hypothetical protein